MSLTEKEIFSQPEALLQTRHYFENHREAIKSFLKIHSKGKFVFIGCGSSYMLAKSGENLFCSLPGTSAVAIAGGDYLINPDWYRESVNGSIVVVLSRSGMTTEILRAVEQMKQHTTAKILSITMKEGNTLGQLSDLNIDLPWAYDSSVCQTRTVTNLYATLLLLCAIHSDDAGLMQSARAAVESSASFLESNRAKLQSLADKAFDNVVVLADGALCGIAEEGALAFTEVAYISGKYFHALDYRHGPVVLNDEKTLTIFVVQPEPGHYQADMIADLKTHGGTMVVLDSCDEDRFGVDCHLCTGTLDRFPAYGIPLIALCQMLAFFKAQKLGINPDQPKGLDAFIALK